MNMALILRCGRMQQDRRGYRDHLLREHNKVARWGLDALIGLEGRELAAVWAGIRRRQTTGMALAAHRREELGLPQVSDREAARRLHDNRARTARRLRAAARARGAATAALGTPVVPLAPRPPVNLRLGTFQTRPLAVPAGIVRYGGARMPRPPCPPCPRCTTCPCQMTRDFSEAQHTTSPPPRRPRLPIRHPSPRRSHTWPAAKGPAHPFTLLDPNTCDDILAAIRGPDGTLPDFGSIPSAPGSPPPELEAEVAQANKDTQTFPVSTCDQSTQVVNRPHQGTNATQTPAPASTSDQGQQVLIRPQRSVAYTQTFRPATSNTTSWTQTHRPALLNTGTGIPQVLTTSTGCQAGTYFDNEVIPPGVPRPTLPWAYTYA